MRKLVLLLSSIALAVLLMSGVAFAAPGNLDPSFDGDGKVLTDFAPSEDPRDDEARDVAVQSDGKIVAAGYAQADQFGNNGGFALARYNPDGSLDASLDGDGKATTNVGGGDGAHAVAIQPDGKIVAVGSTRDADLFVTDFALARYNPDGSLDSSFDGDGKVTVSFAEFDYAYDVAVQPDGKIVVSGSSDYKSFALARLNPDGSLDSGFGTGGKVTSDFDGFYGASAIALQPDGKIVAVGSTRASTYEDFALARYNPDGSPDVSFNGDGRLVTYLTSRNDVASSVALQPDGKILVGGEANYFSAVVRYEPDGSLDASFGSGGKTVSNDDTSALSDLALQPDGKIAALGYGGLLLRYKVDGSIDPSLYTTSQVGGSSLGLQPDGKVVVAGLGWSGGFKDFALARFLGGTDDDPPDTTLTSGPPPFTSDTLATFSFSSSEARSSFRCSLDGAAFGRCFEQNGEFSASYMYLAQGQHTFRVAAVDEANNADPTPASRIWTVDSVAPRGTLVINGTAAYTRSTTVKLTPKAADSAPASGVASMRFRNAGTTTWSAWQTYATAKSWTLTAGAGTKTVHVQYRDKAGNVSETVSDTIVLDTTLPTVSVMSPKNASTTTDTSPTIRAIVRDNLTNLQKANVKLYVNGVLISPTKWSYIASTDALVYNSPRIAKGKKTVRIVATDAAKNVRSTSWYFTIR